MHFSCVQTHSSVARPLLAYFNVLKSELVGTAEMSFAGLVDTYYTNEKIQERTVNVFILTARHRFVLCYGHFGPMYRSHLQGRAFPMRILGGHFQEPSRLRRILLEQLGPWKCGGYNSIVPKRPNKLQIDASQNPRSATTSTGRTQKQRISQLRLN
jgi:hypothetical protein